jgi:hypothetical protein
MDVGEKQVEVTDVVEKRHRESLFESTVEDHVAISPWSIENDMVAKEIPVVGKNAKRFPGYFFQYVFLIHQNLDFVIK